MVHEARAGEAPDGPFEVFCLRSNKSFIVGAGESLLDALEREGVPVPFACRAGRCGVCRVSVAEGEVEQRDTPPSDDGRTLGRKILACASRGRTRLVLDL